MRSVWGCLTGFSGVRHHTLGTEVILGGFLSHATLEPVIRLYCSFPAHFTVRQGVNPNGPDPMCSHSLGSEQLMNALPKDFGL